MIPPSMKIAGRPRNMSAIERAVRGEMAFSSRK